MQQHPVPQNIMQVEFQLVGNMTLRQFTYIAVAGVIAFIIVSAPISIVVKWPLVLLAAATGVAFAFLPYNDIPLDRWVVAFINAVYAPTLRIWKKEPVSLEFLAPTYSRFLQSQTTVSMPRGDRSKLESFLSTMKKKVEKTPLDVAEEAYLHSLDFSVTPPQEAVVPTLTPPPSVNVELQPVTEATPIPITKTPDKGPEHLPEIVKKETVEEKRVVEERTPMETKIAGEVSFKPVATIHFPEKSVYIKPLSNVKTRSLKPGTAMSGTIVLPIRGEKVFKISDSLKQRLEEQGKRTESTSHYAAPIVTQIFRNQSSPEPVLPVEQKTPPSVNQPSYQPSPVPPPAPQEQKPVQPEPEKVIIQDTKASDEEKNRLIQMTDEATKRLTLIAKQNEELSNKLNEYELKSVEQGSRQEEYQKLILDYKAQLERVRTEREYLFKQLGDLQSQLKAVKMSTEKSQTQGTQSTKELEELKNQLKQAEEEKLEAEQQAKKMSSLLDELVKKRGVTKDTVQTQTAVTQVTPQMRVIEPKTAVGKMAPTGVIVPNVVTGVVKDKNGLLLPEVIIVVKDQEGEPVRALKTNKIGQFAVSTPLPNGVYTMELEKEGHNFDVYEVRITGEVLAPIEVRAK